MAASHTAGTGTGGRRSDRGGSVSTAGAATDIGGGATVTVRWIRALMSLVGLAAVLVGLPWALVVWVGWPLPDQWPDLDRWKVWLEQQPTLPTLVDAAACLVWLLWAWTVYALLVEVAARIRRVRRPRLRLAAPLHTLAGSVVGSLILTTRPDAVAATPTGPAPPSAPAPAGAVPVSTDPAIHPPAADPAGGVDSHRPAQGFEVPGGGWLPTRTVVVVAGIGALVWMLRRVRYRPARPGAAARHDADLVPLPTTVTMLRRALHASTAAEAATPVEVEAATVTGGGTEIGVRDGAPLRPVDLPPEGVGLVGPGAVGAARAILVAVLVDAGRADSGVEVHTTRDDLTILLGPAAATFGDTAGLIVHADMPAALAELRSGEDPGSGSTTGTGDVAAAGTGPGRARVLLIEAPDQPAAARLAGILDDRERPLAVVLLGTWPAGATWHVRADGTVRTDPAVAATGGARLGVLDTTAAVDVLTALRLAHAPPPPAAAVVPDQSPRAGTRSTNAAPAEPVQDLPAQPVSPPGRLVLRVLGSPVLSTPAGGGVRIRRTAGWQTLLYLAVHRHGAGSDELKEALWPDVASSSAARRFTTTISELRQQLHAAAGGPVIRHAPDPIRPGANVYRLDSDRIHVDLWQLHDALDTAATALDPDARAGALRGAVGVYGGDLGHGLAGEWIDPDREAARRHIIDAYADLARAEPDHPAALRLLQDAIRHAPHTQALYQLAIARHTDNGDEAGARHTLRLLTERLGDLHLHPDAETLRTAGPGPPPRPAAAHGDAPPDGDSPAARPAVRRPDGR